MEITFSPKPQTLLPSIIPFPSPSYSSSSYLLIGVRHNHHHHLRTCGRRSRHRCRKLGFRVLNARCSLHESLSESSVHVVAAAIAAAAALQVAYLARKRYSSELLDAQFLKPQFGVSADGGTKGLQASCSIPPFIITDTVEGDKQEEAETFSDLPNMIAEDNFGSPSLAMNKIQREITQDSNLEPVNADSVELANNYEYLKKVAKEIYSCNEEEPEITTISCFRSLMPEPLYLIQDSISSSQSMNALKVSNICGEGSRSMAEGRFPLACLREGPVGKEKKIEKVRDFTEGEGRSLSHGNNSRTVSMYPQSNVKGTNDPSAYLRTYSSLLRDGRLKDCLDLLESMDRKGLLDMEKVHQKSFLNACKSQKAVKEAIRFGKLIRNPTMSTFNMLLSVCASSQDFDGAFQVMLLLKEAGLKPDCKLYTTLISTCAKSRKVDAMFEVFHEMVNAGVEPNANTYGALIDGCARAGQLAKAFGAYGIMRSKKVQPDRVIFNALITACGESGAVHRAFDVLAEMMAEPKPIEPDHVTVGALIKTCIQGGQVDRAREVYKMLNHYNIKGTSEVYTIAVRSCSLNDDLGFALKIYDDMKRNGVTPDEMFLSTIVDVAGHAGKVDAAFEIIQDAKRQGIRVGNMSYNSLMGACCNAKNWKKALELYEEIKSSNILPTVSMLNALITSLCDGGLIWKSVQVFNETKKLGVHPNDITYSVLIVACEKKGEAELGFKLFEQAKIDGIRLSLIMVRCLTGLCLQSFENECSLGNTVVTFNSGRPQIDNKWTSLAIAVYREAISASLLPTIDVISQVLGCLKFPHDSSLRNKLIENSGISFDASKSSNISSVLDGFGEYDTRSFSILEEAASFGVVPRLSFKESPIVVDARKLQLHTVEVYLLTTLKSLKHRLAAGAKLPSITVLLPTAKAQIGFVEGEKSVNIAGRLGQAVGSLLRRLGIPYQGGESHGKIRINGLALRRWFTPKLSGGTSSAGKPVEMIPIETRLAKGIADQQRSIRSTTNLSLY
ncbi:pentatricopeptide repeat-containing protein MRL1, chloroplastic [Ananas comosus]|uniref:Pentatricopeptide repeat-containing protein MRL1, chloroplastic n=1 Tax=Ananas comosus TaxID=4615 RepID=A0A6P5EX94_ANACO|nr:pentatricopeptide repeat-containing protein MRL1, chloroplastic [Ananas comosus]